MLNISDQELGEKVDKFVEAFLEIASLCADLHSRRSILATMAELLELDSNELTTALDARAHENLYSELDNACGEFGTKMTFAVVEYLVKKETQFLPQLTTWLEAKKAEIAEDEVYASSDENGHGNDA